mmetsp:Transcript_3674/g.8185  ORF Transcript_3674/g.8185 Transcript_3674/m.8185 type:complete len:253 (+) Transcript_3674:103-861(+)
MYCSPMDEYKMPKYSCCCCCCCIVNNSFRPRCMFSSIRAFVRFGSVWFCLLALCVRSFVCVRLRDMVCFVLFCSVLITHSLTDSLNRSPTLQFVFPVVAAIVIVIVIVAVKKIQFRKIAHLHVLAPNKTRVILGCLEIVFFRSGSPVGGTSVGLSNRLVKGYPDPVRTRIICIGICTCICIVVQLRDSPLVGHRAPPAAGLYQAPVAQRNGGNGGFVHTGWCRIVVVGFLAALLRLHLYVSLLLLLLLLSCY